MSRPRCQNSQPKTQSVLRRLRQLRIWQAMPLSVLQEATLSFHVDLILAGEAVIPFLGLCPKPAFRRLLSAASVRQVPCPVQTWRSGVRWKTHERAVLLGSLVLRLVYAVSKILQIFCSICLGPHTATGVVASSIYQCLVCRTCFWCHCTRV